MSKPRMPQTDGEWRELILKRGKSLGFQPIHFS